MAKTLDIIIVGAGLGGLSAAIALCRSGHNVTVMESARELTEVGAGIQVPPNSSCILDAWGLLEKFKTKAVWPSKTNIRKYSTGEVLGHTFLNPEMFQRYGYGYFVIHRYDYQQLLYNAAIELGAKLILNAKVDFVDDTSVSVKLVDGSIYSADLIVGADGIHSSVRLAVIPDEIVEPRKLYYAYRATVPAKAMCSDPEVAHLIDSLDSDTWIGPRRHIVGYPIKNGELYNLVLMHPAEATDSEWRKAVNLEEMKRSYRDFEPVVHKLLSKVSSCVKWALVDLPVLSNWVSPSGKVVLIGDAAHGMLPCIAQGAAQAVEDGACLGVLLSQVQSTGEIPGLLRLYERLRRPRAEKAQMKAIEVANTWHLPDGDEQIARDSVIKMTFEELQQSHLKSPNLLADPTFQTWLYDHNALEVAQQALNKEFGRAFANKRSRL